MLPKASWKTAIFAGQLVSWVGMVGDDRGLHQAAQAAVMIPTFFGSMLSCVFGSELVPLMLMSRRYGRGERDEILGRCGGRMLLWFVSGSVALAIHAFYTMGIG